MSVKQLWTTPPQFVDSSGNPYSGALLFFYAAGSSTKQNTYTDSGGLTACDNPITLNSSGYPAVSGTIVAPWGTVGQTYKIGLAAAGSSDPPASFIWTEDNVSPINDTAVTLDQWVSGPAPTYIGATSFSLVGDQTSDFQVGRRLKTTNSGGTIYSTIITSAYTTLTTVTVVNDSGTLDSGLSAVSYGLLSPTNPSTPVLADTYPIVSGSSDKTKKVRLEVDGLTTATTRVLTVQDADATLGSFADSSDATKKVAFGLSGITTATTRTLTVADRDSAIGKYPTRQTFTTGSGTYTTPSGALYIRIRMVGAGGGGGGVGTSGQSAGGDGGDTTFSTYIAGGGGKGGPGGAASAGAGGTASGSPDIGLTGGVGGLGENATATTPGGSGGVGAFGGAGQGGGPGGTAGSAGKTNTGGGGGGGGGSGTVAPGSGGGAGAYVEHLITGPSATYSYAVGAAGSAGGAGTSGFAGGAGGSGLIIVDEFYG